MEVKGQLADGSEVNAAFTVYVIIADGIDPNAPEPTPTPQPVEKPDFGAQDYRVQLQYGSCRNYLQDRSFSASIELKKYQRHQVGSKHDRNGQFGLPGLIVYGCH